MDTAIAVFRARPPLSSLKSRLALSVSLLLLLMIAGIAQFQLAGAERDIREGVTAQQQAALAQVARDLDDKLDEASTVAALLAGSISPDVLADGFALSRFLTERQALVGLFDGIAVVDAASGLLRASLPNGEAVGKDAPERPDFRRAKDSTHPIVSEPHRGRATGEPVVAVSAAVRAATGQVLAVVSCTVRLDNGSFLADVAEARVGRSGHYFIVRPGPPAVYVVHPDRRRILGARPDGADPLITAAAWGRSEGAFESLDAEGRLLLMSFKRLQKTGWLVVSSLPADEALQPLHAAKRRTAIASGGALLVAAPLIWLLVWYVLRPLSDLARRLQRLESERHLSVSLPVGRHDEIGAIASMFNALMRRRDEIELRLVDSEKRIRHITDNLPTLICYVDRDYRFQFNNLAYEKFHARPLSQFSGRRLDEVYDPAVLATLRPDLDRALAGERVHFVMSYLGKGGRRHARGIYVPDFDAEGQVRGIFGLVIDDTRLLKTQEQLEFSRQLLQRTGDIAGVGGWSMELGTREVSWSDVTCQLHDVAPGYVPSFDEVLEFVPEGARPAFKEALHRAMASGEAWDLELPMVSAKGRLFWARTVGQVERDDAGKPVRLVGAVQDVTTRRKLEKRLREGREFLQVTLDSIGDAVITTDAGGKVVWLNPVAEQMTGWSRPDATGRLCSEVFRLVGEESAEPAPDPVRTCLSERRKVSVPGDACLIRRDGRRVAVTESAAPILGDKGRVRGAVLVFRDASEERRLRREMTHRASHDPLTGLVNRTEFETRLRRLVASAARHDRRSALLYADLDRFKAVNDACGHPAGDELLREVSKLLRGMVRGRDTVARIGGDEFGIILENCEADQALRLAQQICDHFDDYRFHHDGRPFKVGASIGLVPVDGRWQDMTGLLQAADACCYAAKEAGRNRVHVWFDTDRFLKSRQRDSGWATRLETALAEDRFELDFQRIVPLARAGGGTDVHYELLLRLREPDGAEILPGAFLDIAERFGLASRIDRWVIGRAGALLEANAASHEPPAIISVNMSVQSLKDGRLRQAIGEVIARPAIGPGRLCVEIDEGAVTGNLADAKVFVAEMKALGVLVAVTGIGTASSSFGYLKTLSIDFIKLAPHLVSSVKEPFESTAIRFFAQMASTLGVRTVAEGVETDDVRDGLAALGVDLVQGFRIHRPQSTALLPAGA